jgi:hypothetical protein
MTRRESLAAIYSPAPDHEDWVQPPAGATIRKREHVCGEVEAGVCASYHRTRLPSNRSYTFVDKHRCQLGHYDRSGLAGITVYLQVDFVSSNLVRQRQSKIRATAASRPVTDAHWGRQTQKRLCPEVPAAA